MGRVIGLQYMVEITPKYFTKMPSCFISQFIRMTSDCPRGTILPFYLPIFHKAIFSSMWTLTARGGRLGEGQDACP